MGQFSLTKPHSRGGAGGDEVGGRMRRSQFMLLSCHVIFVGSDCEHLALLMLTSPSATVNIHTASHLPLLHSAQELKVEQKHVNAEGRGESIALFLTAVRHTHRRRW